VRKISYAPGGNRPPIARASSDKTYGPAPFTVQFTGSNSTDPEGAPLSYRWDFGDGSSVSTAANPAHTFQAPAGVPTRYTARLTVTDSAGAISSAIQIISVNNTPPSVKVTSPIDGSEYPMAGDTVFQLTANVADAEHTDGQLAYQWQTVLHHNSHEHTEAVDTNHTTTTIISPVGCDGQTYYYRITLTVTDPAGLSATDEVRLYPDCDGNPPNEQFPAPWTHQDIGAVAAAGSASYSGGTFTVSGSGADIWDTADEFHYAHQPMSGDGQIVARLAAQQNTDPWAKAGVMIREDLTAGSKYAMMAVTSGGLLFQYRSATGGTGGYQLYRSGTAPYWIKLVRSGSVLTGYASPDGAAWTMVGSANIAMANSTFVGMAVTSHNDGTLSTAAYDNVNVAASGGTNLPAAPSGLIATPASTTQVNLTWTDNSGNEDGFEVERSTNNAAFTQVALAAANATSYSNTGLANSTTYYYRLRGFNSSGRSPYSNTASATTGTGGGLPGPWQDQDVGLVAAPGSAGESAGTFTVSGSGEDIWDAADAFGFAYQPWSGDGEIVARVAGIQNTAAWAKVGVMFRETREASSPNALIFITPYNGVGLQSRALAGGNSTFTHGPGLTAPSWIKLVRTGGTFAGYASSDGVMWNLVGTHSLSMKVTVYVGLAVTSHNNSTLNTATFTDARVRAPQATLVLGIGERSWTVKPAVPRLSWMPWDQFGQLSFKIEDHPGQRYVLQDSTDLVHWNPVATLENRTGVMFFNESHPQTHSGRFYRLLLVP
jgi:PKD repeat protein